MQHNTLIKYKSQETMPINESPDFKAPVKLGCDITSISLTLNIYD